MFQLRQKCPDSSDSIGVLVKQSRDSRKAELERHL